MSNANENQDAVTGVDHTTGSLRRRSTGLMLYSWSLGFGSASFVWLYLNGEPAKTLHWVGLFCAVASVCVYVSKGLIAGDITIQENNKISGCEPTDNDKH